MFGKEDIEKLFDQLKKEHGTSPDWEQLIRDAHLGIARSDAAVDLGDIDSRVIALIGKNKPGS